MNHLAFLEINQIKNLVVNNGNYIPISPNYSICMGLNNTSQYVDISNLNIEGSLDLREYPCLSVLICNNNKITKISNLHSSIKFLDCSNNNIEELDFGFWICNRFMCN